MAKTPNGFSDRDPDAMRKEMALAQQHLAKAFLCLSARNIVGNIAAVSYAARAAFTSAKIKTGVALIGLGRKLAP